MKQALTVILVGLATLSFGQTNGKWSVGVGYTPSFQDGLIFSGYINRHLGDKWQVGLMPYTYFGNYIGSNGYISSTLALGLNINSRFTPINFNRFLPYLYVFTGYGYGMTEYSDRYISDKKEYSNILDLSLGIGTEVKLGNNGWSADISVGAIIVKSSKTDGSGSGGYFGPVFSVGVLKRFGK